LRTKAKKRDRHKKGMTNRVITLHAWKKNGEIEARMKKGHQTRVTHRRKKKKAARIDKV